MTWFLNYKLTCMLLHLENIISGVTVLLFGDSLCSTSLHYITWKIKFQTMCCWMAWEGCLITNLQPPSLQKLKKKKRRGWGDPLFTMVQFLGWLNNKFRFSVFMVFINFPVQEMILASSEFARPIVRSFSR